MAIKGNGSTGFVNTASTFTSPLRYTFSFHHFDTVAPDTATFAQPFSIATAGATYDVSFSWRHTSGAASFFMKQAAGSYQQTQIPAGLMDANQWYVITCVYDGTNMLIYLDGVLANSVAASAPPASLSVNATAFAGAAGTSAFDAGRNCECAAWSVALSADKIAMLGKRISPLLVQRSDMLLYWPLIRSVVAVVGDVTSGGGLTVEEHNRVIYPRAQKAKRFTDEKTYLFVPSGGVTLGGAATVVTDYTDTPSGGVTLGGSSLIETNASFSTGRVIRHGGNLGVFQSSLIRGNTFALPDQFGAFTTIHRRKTTFLPDSSELANGRITDRLD